LQFYFRIPESHGYRLAPQAGLQLAEKPAVTCTFACSFDPVRKIQPRGADREEFSFRWVVMRSNSEPFVVDPSEDA
jgi:hypothetical protein